MSEEAGQKAKRLKTEDEEEEEQYAFLGKELFECAICASRFSYPVVQCSTCRKKCCQFHFLQELEKRGAYYCPFCRSPEEPERAADLNSVLGRIPTPCTTPNCDEKPAAEDLDKHLAVYCKFVEVQCPKCSAQHLRGDGHQCTKKDRKTSKKVDPDVEVVGELKNARKEREQLLAATREQLARERAAFDAEKRMYEQTLKAREEKLKQERAKVHETMDSFQKQVAKWKAELIQTHKEEEQRIQTVLFSFYKTTALVLDISPKSKTFSFRSKLFVASSTQANLSCDVQVNLTLERRPDLNELDILISLTKLVGSTIRFPVILGGLVRLLNLEEESPRLYGLEINSQADRALLLKVPLDKLEETGDEVYKIWLLLAARVW